MTGVRLSCLRKVSVSKRPKMTSEMRELQLTIRLGLAREQLREAMRVYRLAEQALKTAIKMDRSHRGTGRQNSR